MHKAQAQLTPQALGALLGPTTYGQTIPVIYGRALGSLYAIWNTNLRKVGQSSGFFGLGASTGEWIQNVDFLVAHNPVVGILQFVLPGGYLLPLAFSEYSFTFDGGHPRSAVTIPDSNFYCLIAVTAVLSYSQTFNDYGGPGPVPVSGTYELPLWNMAFSGPDPVNPRQWSLWPHVFFWLPGSGATVNFPSEYRFNNDGWLNTGNVQVKFYYAAKQNNPPAWPKGASSPLSLLALTGEPQLGDGPEFVGHTAQRIIYPSYYGVGSPAYVMASGEASTPPTSYPNNLPEVLGTNPIYATGDGDFADMFEDIVKSGPVNSGPGNSEGTSYGRIHHGLDLCSFPGAVQKAIMNDSQDDLSVTHGLPNTLNNILVAWGRYDTSGSPISIQDAAANSWTSQASGHYAPAPNAYFNLWTASAKAWPAGNTYMFPSSLPGGGNHEWGIVLELAGLDTIDGAPTVTVINNTLQSMFFQTTNNRHEPAMIYAFTEIANFAPVASQLDPRWNLEAIWDNGCLQSYGPVWAPSNVRLRNNFAGAGFSGGTTVMIGFKNSQMGNYPRTLGNIIDATSLDLCRQQCRAYGLYGSWNFNTQRKASEACADLLECMVSEAVWEGFKLKFVPRAEASAAGNGTIYNAPAAPVFNFTESDFIGDEKNPPVTINRPARFDMLPTQSVQIFDRSANYAPSLVSAPATGAIALFGTKRASPKKLDMIVDPAVGRMIVTVKTNVATQIDRTYEFTLTAKHMLRTAGEIGTITEPKCNLYDVPVVITSIEEDENYNLKCKCDPYIYGCHVPTPVTVDSTTPNSANVFVDPGSINTPIIFEPVPRLYGNQNQNQLWLVVSAPGASYGGCQVLLSVDGGTTWTNMGEITGSAITGLTTAELVAAADPDATNSLLLDLTESLGALDSFLTSDRDNFVYPCYLGYAPWKASTAYTLNQLIVDSAGHLQKVTTAGTSGTSAPTFNHTGGTTADGTGTLVWTDQGIPSIPYELLCYATATQTSAYGYTLPPTLRRAVYGAPTVGTGADHLTGSRFAFLNPGATPNGIMKLNLDPTWIGKTLQFQFPAFNNLVTGSVGGLQNPSSLPVYTYTPAGAVGTVNPYGLPPGLVTAG